jgi:hypothetical protein
VQLLETKPLSESESVRAACDWYEVNQAHYSPQEVAELFGIDWRKLDDEIRRRKSNGK